MNGQYEWRKRRLVALQSVVRHNIKLRADLEVAKRKARGDDADAIRLVWFIREGGMECDLWPNWKRKAAGGLMGMPKTKSLWEY